MKFQLDGLAMVLYRVPDAASATTKPGGVGRMWRLSVADCRQVPWMVYLCGDEPLEGAVVTRVRGWLARRPVGRASVRRARVRAVAVLVVIAAAGVLAVVSHQAWPPVVLGILCTDA